MVTQTLSFPSLFNLPIFLIYGADFISVWLEGSMVGLTYADALTTKEEDNIIAKNDEAVKISTETD